MFCFIHKDTSKKIKINLTFADKIVKNFGIGWFEYTNDRWFHMTRYFDAEEKVIAVYYHDDKELWVYNKELIDILEKLNY